MPQSYLHGGDTLFYLGAGDKAGQTFTPQSTFEIHWVDLELKGALTSIYPFCNIYFAGADHKPWGDLLSFQRGTWMKPLPTLQTKRIRIPMTPYLLQEGTKYAIVVYKRGGILHDHPWWQYDAGDATYPRGLRISSDDFGDTWTVHFDDDHLFAVFGTPPCPQPPPEPPVENWAIIDIEQIITATGYKIIATTNVPCHLYFYWTNHEPNKHKRTTIQRGLTIPAASQYCFVDWHENEQSEPGDTIYHTFVKEPWPVCETRWFTFRGKIDGDWSPSVGPIFKKHRLYVPPPPVTTTFYPDPAVAVDGYAYRHQADNTYLILRNSAGTHADHVTNAVTVSLWTGWARNKWRRFYRGHLLFDTSAIPDTATITSAKIRFLIYWTNRHPRWPDHDFCIVAGTSLSNTEIVPADYQQIGDDLLSDTLLNIHDIVGLPVWWEFLLNAAGLAAINKTGISKFAIRKNTYDRLAVVPPYWISWKGYGLNFWASEKGNGFKPELIVTYQE